MRRYFYKAGLALCMASSAHAENSAPQKAKVLLLVDLASQIHTKLKEETTVATPAGSTTASLSSDATDSKSAKPGGLQLGLLTEKWGMLANITPDTATTGLVGGGYAVVPGQYVGLAYAVNNNSNHLADSKNLQGLLGYHLVPLDESSRFTVLWVFGRTSGRGTKAIPVGDSIYHARGTSFNIVLRYNYKIMENVLFSPALAYRSNKTDIEFTEPNPLVNIDVKRTETITEVTPLALTLAL